MEGKFVTFTTQAWEQIAPVIDAIERHPFVVALGDGSLPRPTFDYYMAQDAAYLHDYSRMLALAAGQAQDADESLFWAGSSQTANSVERTLHASYLGADPNAMTIVASPTCTAYTSWQAMQATSGSYAQLVASLLPCFWIYEYVGQHLLRSAGNLEGHPYQDWIATYADPDFAKSCATARSITDRCCDPLSGSEAEAAMHAFVTSSRYEWMFWDAAWRMEEWPV